MNHTRLSRLTVICLIAALVLPMYLLPSAAAPKAEAQTGSIVTAQDAFANKIHPSSARRSRQRPCLISLICLCTPSRAPISAVT